MGFPELDPDSMGAYCLEESIAAELDGYPEDEGYGSPTTNFFNVVCRNCKETRLYWKLDGITKSGWSLYKGNIRHACIVHKNEK